MFRRRGWFEGRSIRGGDTGADIGWFTPAGTEMTDDDWRTGFARSLAVWLNGDGIASADSLGQRVLDDDFLVLFNAGAEPMVFTVPPAVAGGWVIEFDTARVGEAANPVPTGSTEIFQIEVADRAIVLLRRPRGDRPGDGNGGTLS